MKPKNLTTKIFLDSGSADDTQLVLDTLGFLDGQTTNPSLFVKNEDVQERLARGEKFSRNEITTAYKQLIQDIKKRIPEQSVSIEVYADADTTVDEILEQAREMNTWIDRPHIKLPITNAGLEAAHILSREGVKINMTLIFKEEQAVAVHAATRGAQRGDIFVSPFEGRLDDIGIDGLDVITNIQRLYKKSDGHVEVLMASVRDINHFIFALDLGFDIITAPTKILIEWFEMGMPVTLRESVHKTKLKHVEYHDIDLNKDYKSYNIQHDLTDKGLKKFADDWNSIIES
jgi:transaldolase